MKEARSSSRARYAHQVQGLGEAEAVFVSSVTDIASGANQAGVRLYNERLLLSLVRRFGPLSKIEVARLTGLSVQSTSAIMNRLQTDGLLKREAPLRGRVGQPTVPMSLDPEGAFSLGLKIGRRSLDFVLVDFRGAVRRRDHRTFAFPTPSMILEFVRGSLPRMTEALDERQKRRIAGLGVAFPFQLWTWEKEIGAPPGAMRAWRDFDVEAEIARICPYHVILCNDATTGCAAEFFFGRGWRFRDFLYIFVGAFIGGGLVLDGALRTGRTGNAAALGSMPVMPKSEGGRAPQLISCASIFQLERRLEAAGIDASPIWATPNDWPDFGAPLDAWIEEVALALAYASLAAISITDFEAIIVDGAMPPHVRDRLTTRATQIFAGLDRRGLSDVEIVSGTVGADALAIGGAALPLLKNFGRDREVLLKDTLSQVV
ncbi:MAG TPA: ROK family transcriptional regulator [Roseiarcus sp.]|nr:ROK family transcriptional regulator [Roseiarcus sp.]